VIDAGCAQTVFSGQSGFAAFGMGENTPSDTLDVQLTGESNDKFFFDAFQQLFTGSVSNPTLIPASFDFKFAELAIPVGSTYTDVSVTSAQVAATVAVPEPASAMMIGIGLFSCAGFAILRNRRRMVATNKGFQPVVQKVH
jgi:PEP-CTERM motif